MPKEYTFRRITPHEVRWQTELGDGEGADKYRDWFYFDGHFDEHGYSCSISLHNREFFGGPQPEIEMYFLTPDGPIHRIELFPIGSFKPEPFGASWGPANVFEGKMGLNGQPESYHMKVSAGDISVDFTCRAVVTGVKFVDAEPGYTYYHPVKKMALGWWPLVPRAEAEGTVTIGEKTVKVKGLAYLERQLACMPLGGGAGERTGQALWCWGHFFAGDYTALWTDSAASEHYGYSHFTPFVLWKGNTPIMSTYQFAGYVEKFAISPENGLPYPLVETIKASDGIREVTAQLVNGSMLLHMELAPQAWYSRMYSDVNVQIRHWGEMEQVKGRSLHEWGCTGSWFPYK